MASLKSLSIRTEDALKRLHRSAQALQVALSLTGEFNLNVQQRDSMLRQVLRLEALADLLDAVVVAVTAKKRGKHGDNPQ